MLTALSDNLRDGGAPLPDPPAKFHAVSVLDPDQIDRFIETGMIIVPDVFSTVVAAQCYEEIFRRIPPDAKGKYTLQEHFGDGPFAGIMTPRFSGILNDLLGENRWHGRDRWGWFPVTLPSPTVTTWKVPEEGWHVDGAVHRTLTSPHQALLPILLFNDIDPGDGGTAVSLGSHRDVAKILAKAEPTGLSPSELQSAVSKLARANVAEVTGSAGSVAFLHPFMLHASSPNTTLRPRVIANPRIQLREPLRISDGGLPVERAIAGAISEGNRHLTGVEQLNP
jgi:hypothetical protein